MKKDFIGLPAINKTLKKFRKPGREIQRICTA
jgi:hypothetical protein